MPLLYTPILNIPRHEMRQLIVKNVWGCEVQTEPRAALVILSSVICHRVLAGISLDSLPLGRTRLEIQLYQWVSWQSRHLPTVGVCHVVKDREQIPKRVVPILVAWRSARAYTSNAVDHPSYRRPDHAHPGALEIE
jgi:hypothetical protein